jgi:hypothetical protein
VAAALDELHVGEPRRRRALTGLLEHGRVLVDAYHRPSRPNQFGS